MDKSGYKAKSGKSAPNLYTLYGDEINISLSVNKYGLLTVDFQDRLCAKMRLIEVLHRN